MEKPLSYLVKTGKGMAGQKNTHTAIGVTE